MRQLPLLPLFGLALTSLALPVRADSLDRTGSLLVFPLFDNNRGGIYTLTVTNTNANTSPVAGGLLAGTVDVEFVYINGSSCLEFNRTRRLTPNDTITVTTRLDNPNQVEGYAYAFAKSPTTGKAIAFDWLAGESFHVAPMLVGGVDIPPIVFASGFGIPEGNTTDLDNDGVRDINGGEYDEVSDELLVPRFLADESSESMPSLVLIGLTGADFHTIVNFLIYNDNEEVFSAQYTFDCWDKVRLKNINGAFTNTYLLTTGHALLEQVLFTGNPGMSGSQSNAPLEYGWFRMDGAVAFSSAASVQDPAFLAVRLDVLLGGSAAGASLPYGLGEQSNGDLVQHGPFPDPN